MRLAHMSHQSFPSGIPRRALHARMILVPVTGDHVLEQCLQSVGAIIRAVLTILGGFSRVSLRFPAAAELVHSLRVPLSPRHGRELPVTVEAEKSDRRSRRF